MAQISSLYRNIITEQDRSAIRERKTLDRQVKTRNRRLARARTLGKFQVRVVKAGDRNQDRMAFEATVPLTCQHEEEQVARPYRKMPEDTLKASLMAAARAFDHEAVKGLEAERIARLQGRF